MKGAFSTPVCARKQTNFPPGIDQGFSTGSCNHRHALSCTHPPPSVPPFLLVQNLSSKQIAPTDSMWAKSDNAKGCHQLLKVENIVKGLKGTRLPRVGDYSMDETIKEERRKN